MGAATTDAGLKQSDFDTKEDNYNTVKATVAVERTNAENHQTDSNAAIEATRVKTISDANTFETTTASANTARSEEETACDTAQTDRLAMIGGDEAAITEITRLVNKLDRCKAETTASSSLLEEAVKVPKKSNGDRAPYLQGATKALKALKKALKAAKKAGKKATKKRKTELSAARQAVRKPYAAVE